MSETELKSNVHGRKFQDLGSYSSAETYSRGRSTLTLVLWSVFDALLVSSWLPGSWHRRALLRAFGAEIGRNVVIKPRTRVKFPWKLEVGDHSWIGESVWIDNLAPVTIGEDACLSQGVYLCTGSHDWSRPSFDLIVKPIEVGDGAWIAAGAVVGPGVQVGSGAVLTVASVATTNLNSNSVYRGNPAEKITERLK